MKILYVVKNLRVSNGVSSYIMNYYRKLIKKDDVKMDFLIIKDAGSPYYEEIEQNGSKIYFLPSLKKVGKVFCFLDNLFKEGKYDILHSNVFNSNVPIVFFAKKNNVQVRILHSHATSNGDTLIKKIRNKPFQYLSVKFSNVLFSCSNLAGKNIFKNKKFYVINNAIDLEKFAYDENKRIQIRSKYEIEKNKLIIATVGRITEQKNPYFILKIISELKKQNLNFIFWWFGSGNLDNEIIEASKEMNIYDKIKFFGSINDLSQYYSSFDLFILPSLYEGLPVVGIEAQVNGVKCIMSDTITREVVLTSNTDMIPINNEKDWCRFILENIRNDRKYVNESSDFSNYDISELSNNLYNLYYNLLELNMK